MVRRPLCTTTMVSATKFEAMIETMEMASMTMKAATSDDEVDDGGDDDDYDERD